MPPAPAGTPTGTATILFTDLVGSTSCGRALGEERAEARRQAHHRLLGDTIAKHRGTLHDDLGDGIMASFAGAADAVAAAVAIQQAITADGRRAARDGGRRSASASARATSRGRTTHPHGLPAGRGGAALRRRPRAGRSSSPTSCACSRAVAAGTRSPRSARSRSRACPSRVAACAVNWEPLATAGCRCRRGSSTQGAGRDVRPRARSRRRWRAAWAKAKDGQRQLVLLAGEPGIGKTRLATEAALRGARRGRDGAARHLRRGRRTCRISPSSRRSGTTSRTRPRTCSHAHVREHKGELVRLVPELARRVADLPAPQVAEAETERYLLFEAVTGLLSEASQQQPIVLVLDDLHWAGAPELLLLKHIAARRRCRSGCCRRHLPRHRSDAHASADRGARRSPPRDGRRAPRAARPRRGGGGRRW